ncbi:MAG: FKBP-type peptidyl-prolyl cis-trans isomerase [Massilia sp.]
MKLKLPLVAAFVAMLALTACGGGGGGDSAGGVAVSSPATLVTTDTAVGTGAEAATGKTVTVNYTGWLYIDANNHKGTQFDTGTLQVKLGAANVIAGFEQGILGMKVGGKRTVLIPASLGYGASGRGSIPPNSGLVFDIELTNVQ